MEPVGRLLPCVDAPGAGVRWPILAQLTKAVTHERNISEEIKSAVKLKLKSEHALPCLNCLTILHTLAFNVDATVRQQLAHPSFFKRIDKTVAKPCSASVATAVHQLLVDWAYAFGREELGAKSRDKLPHMRARHGEGGRPSSMAVAFLDEAHMGMPRLGFRRGLDFAKLHSNEPPGGERAMSPMSPLTSYYRSHSSSEAPLHRRQSSELAEVDSLLAAGKEVPANKVMEVVDRILRTVAQLQEAGRSCLEAARSGAVEAVRRPLDDGFLAACRCSSWRTRVQSMALLVTNGTALERLLPAVDSLNTALADWQALTTHHILPALYPSHRHPRRPPATTTSPPPATAPPPRAPPRAPPPDILDADPLPPAPPVRHPHLNMHLLDTTPSYPPPDLLTSSPMLPSASTPLLHSSPSPALPTSPPLHPTPSSTSTHASLPRPHDSNDPFFGHSPLYNPFAGASTPAPAPQRTNSNPEATPQSAPTSPSEPSPPPLPNPLHSAPHPYVHHTSPPQRIPPTRPPPASYEAPHPLSQSPHRAPPPPPAASQAAPQPPPPSDSNPFRNPQAAAKPRQAWYLRPNPLGQAPRGGSQPSPRQPPAPPQSMPMPQATPPSSSSSIPPPQPNGHHHPPPHHPHHHPPAPHHNPYHLPIHQIPPAAHRSHADPSPRSLPHHPSPYTTPNPSPRGPLPNPFDAPSPNLLSPRPPSPPNPLTSPRPPTGQPPFPLLAQLEAITSAAPHPTCLCPACRGLSAPGRKLLERIRQLLASCHLQHEEEVNKLRATLAAAQVGHQEHLARLEAGHQQELNAIKATAVQKMRQVLQSQASISSTSRPTSPYPASSPASPEPHPASPDPDHPSRPTLILPSASASSSAPPTAGSPPQQQRAPSDTEAALRAELAALKGERNSLAARLARLDPSGSLHSAPGHDTQRPPGAPPPPAYPLLMGYMLLTGDAPPFPADHAPLPTHSLHPEPSLELI